MSKYAHYSLRELISLYFRKYILRRKIRRMTVTERHETMVEWLYQKDRETIRGLKHDSNRHTI